MPVFNISPMFQPQYVANAAAALTFASAGGTTVPAGYQYRVDVLRVTNITAAPVSLKAWRVPSGSTDDNQHIVVPVTVLVPVATQTFPQFDVTALWGAVLSAGDAIWMVAGAASSLVVYGDGLVVQI